MGTIQPGTAPAGGYAPVVDPALRTDVATRADRIEALLDSDGVTQWADRSEVMDAARAIFAGTDARGADAVVDELGRRGALDTFAAEVMDGSWVGGGLSVTQRQELFKQMARQLDGDTLARVSDAFASTEAISGGHRPVAELGRMVGIHASQAAKLDYLAAQAPKTTDKPSFDRMPGLNDEVFHSDAEALAAAHVVGSLRDSPAGAEAAFRTLDASPGAIEAVVTASAQYETTFASGPMGAVAASARADTRLYSDVMAAAAAIPSDASYPTSRTSAAGIKAEVLAAGMATHAMIGPSLGAERGAVLGGAERLISSDADGVTGHMANNQDYQNGTVLARYAKAQIEAGNEAVLGRQFVASQLGDGHTARGAVDARFGAPTAVAGPNGGAVFPYAVTGGYFMGAMHAASLAVHADQTARAETATTFAEAGIDAAATFAPDRGAALSSLVASGAKAAVGAALECLLVTEDPIADRAFYYAGIPRDADGNQAASSLAVGDYHRRFDEVSRFANP